MARYLVDTNVLLRAAEPDSAQHFAATEAVRRLNTSGVTHLLTFNVNNFRAYNVTVVSPDDVVAS